MSLGVTFSAGEASCSQSSVRPSRSYAVFVYCHPVVFTVARCRSFGVGESSGSQSSSCLAASSLSSSSRSSWHRHLSSSSCPAWHPRCRLPHVRRGIVVVVFLTPVVASSLVVFLMPGVAYTAFFRSAPRGCQCARRCSVLSGAGFAMRGGLPFRSAQHARRSSVPPGAAYAEVFRSVWRGLVCAAFFRSARRGMCCVLPFRPVRHTQRCSVLSGAARCARRCCGFVIGGPGLLVALPDDPVVIGASDPRSRRWSRYAAQRCGKVGQGR